MHLVTILGIFSLLLSVSVSAEIYRSVDKHGNPVFSDTKAKNAVAIDIPDTNTSPAVETPPPPKNKRPAVSEDIPNLSIRHPKDGQILANGLIGTQVKVALSKPLPKDFQIKISLDGQVLASGRQTHIDIPQLSRGPHHIKVQLIDEKNRSIGSDSIRIMVYWPNN